MSHSDFTLASVIFGCLLAVVFACLELFWLGGWPRGLSPWRELRSLSLVNIGCMALAIGGLSALGGASFFLLICPVPIVPLIYIGVKFGAYHRLSLSRKREGAGAALRRPRTLVFGSLLFHSVAGFYAFDLFSSINPTRENLELAIHDRSDKCLEVMLWISVTRDPEMTALVNEAIADGNTDAVRKLVCHGANPKREYWLNKANGETLWFLTKWMLDKGLKPEEINLSQGPGFESIAVGGDVEDLNYCLKKGFQPKKYPHVMNAVIEEQPMEDIAAINAHMKEKMRILLASGVDINEVDYTMFKPIFSLLLLNLDLSPVLTFMIRNGAEVNARSVNSLYPYNKKPIPPGITPLILATIDHKVAYIDILLANGAKKSLRDSNGCTAFDYAVETKAGDEIIRKVAFSTPDE